MSKGRNMVRLKMCRRTLVALTLMALALCCWGCQDDSSIAAKYDGGTISESAVTAYTQEFRKAHGYEGEKEWAEYLVDEDLTPEMWREQVIASMVDDRLFARKAEELGIKVDEERLRQQEESDRESSGTLGDDEAWARYLDAHGSSVERYRENLEKASLKQQVLSHEVQLDALEDQDKINEYMAKNLGARVVKRYRALLFKSKEAAEGALTAMAGLEGDELSRAFDGWVERDDSDSSTAENGGDIGWDIATDLGSIQYDLNEEDVAAGSLSAKAHDTGDGYLVLLCTNEFVFHVDTTYDGLPDDELKAYILQSANYAYWAELSNEYLVKQREEANVMVRQMPKGLPYDVDFVVSDGNSSATSSADVKSDDNEGADGR